MPVLHLILSWCYFSCLKMYLDNILMLIFMSKCFLKSLCQSETQVSFFWKITVEFSFEQLIFINKLRACFLGVMVLTFWFISIFQRNENRFFSLVLKPKEQKAIHLSYIFHKFYLINPPISFCYFFIFPVYES